MRLVKFCGLWTFFWHWLGSSNGHHAVSTLPYPAGTGSAYSLGMVPWPLASWREGAFLANSGIQALAIASFSVGTVQVGELSTST